MDEQQILELVARYCHSIHTQEADDFFPLWNRDATCTLITPSHFYTGLDSIYRDFLLGAIRKNYARIDLVAEQIDIRIIGEATAIVIFSYSTDCDLRESGEPFGIAGLETQVYCKSGSQWKLTHVHYSLNKQV